MHRRGVVDYWLVVSGPLSVVSCQLLDGGIMLFFVVEIDLHN